MGNEHSKNKDQPNRNGRIPEKHINGSAKGLPGDFPSNGLEIPANGETTVQKNSEPISLKLAPEPNDFVIVELDPKPADAPVISEVIETVIHKEEVKQREEDQTDVGLPATESTSSGEEAAATIIAVHLESIECPLPKAEISTQTDGITEADISTQTDKDEDVPTIDNEGPVEQLVSMKTGSTEEDPLNGSACVIAEEPVQENMVVRVERAELTDIDNTDPEGEGVNGHDETEPNITAEPGFNQKVSEIEGKTVAEENNIGETSPLEVYRSFPKVVAVCVEAVFAGLPQSTGFAAVDSSVIADGDNGEGAGDMSVDAGPTEPAKPQSTVVRGANGVRSSATTLMETIAVVVCEAPDPPPADQDAPREHLSGAVAQQEKLGDSCPEDHIINAEVPDKPVITEELPVGPGSYEEAEPSPVSAKYSTELTWEAAINALSQELESSGLPPQEAAGAKDLPLIQEVITASSYGGFTGGQEASIAVTEELVERVADGPNVDANGMEAVAESLKEDTTNTGEAAANLPPMDATGEAELCASVQEKLKDDNVAPAEVPANPNHVLSEGPVEESSSLKERRPKSSVPIVVTQTMEEAVMRQIMPKTDTSAVVDSRITTSDESMSESFDAVLEAIVEEIINEDVFSADGRLVTSEELSPQVFVEEEADEDAEKESSGNSSDSTVDSQSVTRTDIEALAVSLQSACKSVVEESTNSLGGLMRPSLGYSITVTVHVAPNQEQQLNAV
ncbi:uncharacterized protein AB9W97_017954 isoform 2-T2 [Spinachia spinachia]